MVRQMVVWYDEGMVERAQWDYQARQVCTFVCHGCCRASCEVGVGTIVSLVWVIVFVPRGLTKLLVRTLKQLGELLLTERLVPVWVGVLQFSMRWLSLVVMGGVIGVLAQSVVCITVHSVITMIGWCMG